MKATRLAIPDVMLFEPKIFGDDRGFFYESFNHQVFAELSGLQREFVQDNHSKSARGVLRGLHYQLPPMAQGKLVRVIAGEVFDVAVDIRKESDTFGQWVGATLSAENAKQLWIPEGFAHGFYVTSPEAEFVYKCTNYYSTRHERTIAWDSINIDWPVCDNLPLSISDKDGQGQHFAEIELPDQPWYCGKP